MSTVRSAYGFWKGGRRCIAESAHVMREHCFYEPRQIHGLPVSRPSGPFLM
jgi:hypothetical protein